MQKIRCVTLTGVDEQTSVPDLALLSQQHPLVEWGVLVDPDRAGLRPRFPRLNWLEMFVQSASGLGLNVALHFCGKSTRALLEHVKGVESPLATLGLRLRILARQVGRVQLNIRATNYAVEDLALLCRVLAASELSTKTIVQWNSLNKGVCEQLSVLHPGVELLVDSSGGRGNLPAEWPSSNTVGAQVGYSGGLGPDNIEEQLPQIAQAAGLSSFWVDMETGVRDESDKFCLVKARAVLEQVDQVNCQTEL